MQVKIGDQFWEDWNEMKRLEIGIMLLLNLVRILQQNDPSTIEKSWRAYLWLQLHELILLILVLILSWADFKKKIEIKKIGNWNYLIVVFGRNPVAKGFEEFHQGILILHDSRARIRKRSLHSSECAIKR